MSLGLLDFEFVGDRFSSGLLGVLFDGRFLFLGLDRTAQSDHTINRDNLGIWPSWKSRP